MVADGDVARIKMLWPRCVILLFILCACRISQAGFQHADDSLTSFAIPEQTGQVIVVTTASWNSKEGTLQRYERVDGNWKKTGDAVQVMVGKNGLGWGRGKHKNTGSPEKVEGDGKAPAGVFSLGTLFGYAEKFDSPSGYPYRQATARDYYVDDIKSTDYNQWVTIPAGKANTPNEFWASCEKMRRADHLYEYGIVISHNEAPAVKGKGSAIFFHVWRAPGLPTVGCTSMRKEDLVGLMKWLDPAKEPLLIQVPESELHKLY